MFKTRRGHWVSPHSLGQSVRLSQRGTGSLLVLGYVDAQAVPLMSLEKWGL